MSKLFCLTSEKGSILKGKKNAPLGSKFFPFKVYSLSVRGLVRREANRKSQKLFLSYSKEFAHLLK